MKAIVEYVRKNLQPVVIYLACSIALALCFLTDALTVAETLKDAFVSPIPHLFGFGVVLINELILFGVIFSGKNLFALGKISSSALAFYAAMFLSLGGLGIYSATNIIRHIEALGAKNRAMLHAVDYSNDPLLLAANDAVRSLQRQLSGADSSMTGVARAASGMATASLSFVNSARLDTGRAKRDQLFYAGRSNRAQLNVTTALTEMQRDRQALQVSLLHAVDRRDSVFTALDRRYRGRSAQDVVEMDMGINLKGRVATLTVAGTIGVMLLMMMTSFSYGGKAEYFPFDFSPRSSSAALHPMNAPATANSTSPVASIIPAMGAGENRSQYVRRLADMWLKKEFPPYISQAFLAAQFKPKMSAPRFCKIVAERKRKLSATVN